MEDNIDISKLKYNSTHYWFDCAGKENEFGDVGKTITNGRNNPISFKIKEIYIKEFQPYNECLKIVLNIKIQKVTHV